MTNAQQTPEGTHVDSVSTTDARNPIKFLYDYNADENAAPFTCQRTLADLQGKWSADLIPKTGQIGDW